MKPGTRLLGRVNSRAGFNNYDIYYFDAFQREKYFEK
jgi:hypothetical protein